MTAWASSGATAADRQWGDIASDRLAAALDEYNRKYKRYELVDRKRLKDIMNERDMQMAIGDASAAKKIGTLANVDAMLYGTVHILSKDERATKRVPDPFRGSMKTVSYTKRFIQVTVNFTLDDVRTGRTLDSATPTRHYDSEDKKSGGANFARLFGVGGDDVEAVNEVVNQMIDELSLIHI